MLPVLLWPLKNNPNTWGPQVKWTGSRDKKAIKLSLRKIVLIPQVIVPVGGWGWVIRSAAGNEGCRLGYEIGNKSHPNSKPILSDCYVPYHRSNSVSVSAWDALQTHSWSSSITSHTLPFSVRTIPVPAWVLRHPTISEITITLSFGTSLVNGLHPTHASLLSISDYSYTQSRYHMIQFPLPHVYSTSPYACFHITMRFLIFDIPFTMCLLPYYKPLCFSSDYLNIEYLSCHSQFWIST